MKSFRAVIFTAALVFRKGGIEMKTFIANVIWKICGISPEWGNRVMDFSEKLYNFAMYNHSIRR